MIKKHKPTTPGRRGMSVVSYRGVLTEYKPHKPLTKGKKLNAGRSSSGRISVRHQGGGHKRRYRDIDFKMNKLDVPAKVATIEYDPYRSGFIALLNYADGEKRYTLLPEGKKVGDEILTSENAPIRPGNRLPLSKIPAGTVVYNIEIQPGAGASDFGAGLSAMTASVVNNIAALLTAFCNATLSTFAGSIIPATRRSVNSPVAALKP